VADNALGQTIDERGDEGTGVGRPDE
jgi:hypothetical protein